MTIIHRPVIINSRQRKRMLVRAETSKNRRTASDYPEVASSASSGNGPNPFPAQLGPIRPRMTDTSQ